jgi:hypothetical protein
MIARHGGLKTCCGMKPSLLALFFVTFALSAIAQQTPASPPARDAVTPLPAFEVASIKPSKADGSHSDTSFDHGCFISTNISLKFLIQNDAYGIPAPQIIGGPKWFAPETPTGDKE